MKISARTAASTPLTGAEIIAIIQGGSDRKVAIDQLPGSTAFIFPESYGAKGDGVTDDTAALQAAITAAEQDAGYGGGTFYLLARRYKITSTLLLSKQHIRIIGAGIYQSTILFNGVAGGCFTTTAIAFLRPFFADFSIVGDSSSGPGIDFSNVTSQVYDGALERMYIQSGGNCIYAPKFFSGTIKKIIGVSFNQHCFRVNCGPGVNFIDCYAQQSGTGKVGYRLAGTINLFACNGVNSAGWWGLFGQDTTAADGFQADFPGLGELYPDVNLYGCNVEGFTIGGILCHQAIRSMTWIGGGIDRAALSSAYTALLMWRKAPLNTGSPVRLRMGYVSTGSGVPNGGAALTNAWFYVQTSHAFIIDESGACSGLPGVYADSVAGLYPLATYTMSSDIFQNVAHAFNAIIPRRLTVRMQRYDQPAALTPVGAGQAISVTGYTKVTVTPAAGASITTATFSTSLGVESDWQRNGELVIEAGNANLTVNHTALGGAANTFVMAGGANLSMGSGFIVKFLRSETTNQWIEIS